VHESTLRGAEFARKVASVCKTKKYYGIERAWKNLEEKYGCCYISK